jgi:hypothetical protein
MRMSCSARCLCHGKLYVLFVVRVSQECRAIASYQAAADHELSILPGAVRVCVCACVCVRAYMRPCVCVPVCVCVCLSIPFCLSLSLSLSVCLCLCLSSPVCPSLSLAVSAHDARHCTGEMIRIVRKHPSGWWEGITQSGTSLHIPPYTCEYLHVCVCVGVCACACACACVCVVI